LDVSLERCGSVGKTKRHDSVLKEAEVSTECRFPLVALSNANEVESILEVNDRENSAALDTVQEVAGKQEWVAILLGDGIKGTIIYAEAKFARFAASEEDGGGSRTSRTPNKSLSEMFFDVIDVLRRN